MMAEIHQGLVVPGRVASVTHLESCNASECLEAGAAIVTTFI